MNRLVFGGKQEVDTRCTQNQHAKNKGTTLRADRTMSTHGCTIKMPAGAQIRSVEFLYFGKHA